MNVSEIISIDTEILGRTPVFKGTKVPVKILFDYLAAGDSSNDILSDVDYISKDHCSVVSKQETPNMR